MKRLISSNCFSTLALVILLLSNFGAFAQKTNIWVVRIAEPAQDLPGANNINPGLSEQGRQRADA